MAASGYELSLSLFRKFRPKNILLVEANRFRTGLCEQCLNVTFKTHAFTGIGFKGIPDKYSLLDQCKYLHNNLPSRYILSVQDFAENYRHVTQNEISSSYRQSSLFTNVSSYKYHNNWNFTLLLYIMLDMQDISIYRCPACQAVVDESIVFITDYKNHDPDVVKRATDVLEDLLKTKTSD